MIDHAAKRYINQITFSKRIVLNTKCYYKFKERNGNTTVSHASDDDFRSGCRNVGQRHQQQSISGLLSPGRSNHTND